MLFLGVWLLVQIPFVSAQETGEQEVSSEVDPPVAEADPLRDAERAYLFGGETDETTQPSVEGSAIWSVVRMILVLALAAAAVYGIVFFIKRSSKQTVESSPFLKILASSHLGSNRYAHVVAVGSKAWLLGSSDGGVNLIGEVEDKDVINAMLLEDSKKTAEASPNSFPDFMSMLRRLGAPSESRSSGADDIRRRRERLKGL